jgi:hypothetical protein
MTESMTEPPMVAASEHDLLMITQTLLAPQEHDVWTQLCRTRPMPRAIGTTCAYLLEDTLEQVWPALWRRGGTQPGASSAGGAVARGRLWERHQPVELAFSRTTLELLRWIVATSFTAPISTIAPLPAGPLTIGDQVMIYLALDAAAATPAIAALVRQPLVREAPLAWLGFGHLLVEPGRDEPVRPDFDTLAHGAGAIVVEALAGELGRRWHDVELGKREIVAPAALIALGSGQELALRGFQAACDKRRRRDLASFILDAAGPSLERGIAPIPALLDQAAPLSQRMAARQGAGALLRGLIRWREWDTEHRGVRFIDDDYATAQLLLARFERIGSVGAERAAAWLSELASLAPSG